MDIVLYQFMVCRLRQYENEASQTPGGDVDVWVISNALSELILCRLHQCQNEASHTLGGNVDVWVISIVLYKVAQEVFAPSLNQSACTHIIPIHSFIYLIKSVLISILHPSY